MPIIRVDLFEGRSPKQKKAIVKELSEGLARTAGCSVEAVEVLITDHSKDNWSFGGQVAREKFPD